jgi:hypothetical protein
MPLPVDYLTATSLHLRMFVGKCELGVATGFVVFRDEKPLLITSRHVLSGRHPDSGQPISKTGGIPDRVEITHHKGPGFGSWITQSYLLADASGKGNWLGHVNSAIDVGALPITVASPGRIYPFDLTLMDTRMLLRPGMSISIIGFPLGLTGVGSHPLWKTGHIATDPNTNYDHKPCILIDATTRKGMSGSPVIRRTYGPYEESEETVVQSFGEITTKLVGIYSGRLREEAEIGIVWKPNVISEVISEGISVSQI